MSEKRNELFRFVPMGASVPGRLRFCVVEVKSKDAWTRLHEPLSDAVTEALRKKWAEICKRGAVGDEPIEFYKPAT